ncbi:MAG: hypothetical protein NTU47_15245 [Ignavibacteriales bacterium]|nr:hypothetical protein [Ignavibacteriales bacterium]
MKFLKHILIVSSLLAIVTIEASAQNSSSASQMVTFGVHRSAPVILASAQASSVAVSEAGFERANPLKVTVGTDSRSLAASEMGFEVSEQTYAANKPKYPAVKSFNIKTPPAEKAVFTLTE